VVKLNLIILRTSRLEESMRFYSLLGAQFVSERHGNGPEHYAATFTDGVVLEIYPLPEGMSADSSLRLGFNVDDIEATLGSLGMSATPSQSQWGLRAVIRDPDGRTVELSQNQSTRM
jgi:predicted enzyme related to lactoylglutathione lyase